MAWVRINKDSNLKIFKGNKIATSGDKVNLNKEELETLEGHYHLIEQEESEEETEKKEEDDEESEEEE